MGSDWQVLRIEEIAEKIAMGPFGSNIKVDTFVDDGIPVISGGHLHETRLQDGDFNFVTEEHAARLKNSNVYRGDVVFTHAGNIGQVSYIPESSRYERYVISQRQFYLRCNRSKADPAFVTYFFHSPVGKHQLLANASQVGVPSISRPASNLKEIEIALPALQEQRKIASVIGVIDDRIDVLRQTNATLEAIAQALFKSWFVDFDPVRAKADGREPEGMDAATAALFPDMFKVSELGLIPEGWEVSNLGDQLEILSGGTPKTKVPEYWDGDIPWFSVVDAPKEGQVFVLDTERRITQSGLENSPARLLPANTTIISARGTVGKLAVTGQPMAMNQSCYGLRPADGVGESFTYFSVQRFVDHLQRIAHGAVFDTITRSSFSQAQAVKAPKEIISAFEALVTPFMERVHANGRQAITLTQLRDTLLPRLISGKLRLPEAEREIEAAIA